MKSRVQLSNFAAISHTADSPRLRMSLNILFTMSFVLLSLASVFWIDFFKYVAMGYLSV
jgi:hypothetical protein